MPSISSALDATISELNRLHQTDRERRDGHVLALRTFVAGLDVVLGAPDEAPADDRRPDRARGVIRTPIVSPVVPQDRGWPNAVVREKIVSEALRGGRW